ncbi:Y-family DNA polymerase [Ancylobacter sonchi]|uniref:Y-family DNA polymerase n=1 Tax=Ancylobacter sonchi TaxID=1937790 RepID=UPI001BD49F01|nr:Y-family DNA polymerase [Ancylobacter sonchi]MBS7532311.1 Y-family DNA polymerase [Ancylobacter sonchi]
MAVRVALVDCNNFYASCERVFQPHLRGKPIIVLSNNDGCVIARSNEAKALGIAMGEPWHLVRERLPTKGIIVRSSNYALYGDMSARVMQVLARFTPLFEAYSIDEAFLGLAGLGGREEPHLRELRATVARETGIPVSVGFAPTKTLAKLANRFAKKEAACDGVLVLDGAYSALPYLDRCELTDLWGISHRLAARLSAMGIVSPRALAGTDARHMRERFGVVMERLVLELQGVPCIGLEDAPADRKSILCSRSFGRMVTDRREMEEAVATYVARAAEKMRRQNLATAQLHLFLHTNRFRPADPQYAASRTIALNVATADTMRLTTAALDLLGGLWRDGYAYKKAGVMLLELVPARQVQQGLFDKADSNRRKALMTAIDAINRDHGRGTVTLAAAGRTQAWALKSAMRSPRFTTRWDELLAV